MLNIATAKKIQTEKGEDIEEHLSQVNMDPWYYIYEHYIQRYSIQESSQNLINQTSKNIHEQKITEKKTQHEDQNLIVENNINLEEYGEKCRKILEDEEIRFVGLLDEYGTTLAGGYKDGMNPRLTPEQHKSVCQELASRVAKRKKFDTELGRVKYSASRREHVVIMSFPIYDKVIMIVAEPNVNIDRLSFRILDKLGKQWSDYA